MAEGINKLPIYEGVACLEVWSAHGARWWYPGGALAYSPVLVEELRDLGMARVEPYGRSMLVAHVPGLAEWVAVNLARTDVAALRRRGRWSPEFPTPPFARIAYTAWPAYTHGRRKEASAARLTGQSSPPRSS